jgi:uncharacterized membrane protein YvbJ
MMVFCNKCGNQFEGNFCDKCGAPAKNSSGINTQQPNTYNQAPVQYSTPVPAIPAGMLTVKKKLSKRVIIIIMAVVVALA